MDVVQDIHRPDVNGTAPKMARIADLFRDSLRAPALEVTTDDNLCSSVCIRGALSARETWPGGIFHNAPCFILFVRPASGSRYYTEGEQVRAELSMRGPGVEKFRAYKGTPERVLGKVLDWLNAQLKDWLDANPINQ